MVQLFLTSTKGNGGSRHFPFHGYLGLTPIRVEGIVRTRLDEDLKPIQAKSLTVSVRAYESRPSRIGSPHTRLLVDYSQTLWRKPDGQSYADLGEFDATFKITLPKRVAGFSSANYQDYRTFWRVEAVLEHIPMASVGSKLLKQFDLMLIRYDIPPPLPPPTPPKSAAVPSFNTTPTLSHVTNKPRAPVLHYNLSTPPYPIGPSDLLFTSVFVRPQDPSVRIRSASLLVERRIDLHGVELSSSQHPPQIVISSSMPERDVVPEHDRFAYNALSHSTLTLDSTTSSNTVNSRTPLIPHSSAATSSSSSSPISPHPSPLPQPQPQPPSHTPSHKTLTFNVAGAEGTSFAWDKETGVWSKTISLQWPAARSHSRWAMGETMRGSLGAVSFWARVKVIVTSSSGATESIDLAPRELLVVLTNDAERRHALAMFAEMRTASSSKSRASTSPSPNPSLGHEAAAASSPAPPPPMPIPVYTPPKSAGQVAGSSRHGTSSQAPISSSPPLASPTSKSARPPSSTAKTEGKSKKPRRPHTSAGPRDSVDVRVGGAVPVSEPVPVPANGYSSSSSVAPSNSSAKSFDGGHGRSMSSGKYSPDQDSSEGQSIEGGPDAADGPRFQTLNTAFTGLNGIGGPRALALMRGGRPSTSQGARQSRGEDTEGLLVRADVGAVRMDKVRQHSSHTPRTNVPPQVESRASEDKSELIRAWEEELVKIEKASRRNSNLLAFWRKRDKPKELKHRIAT